MSKHTVLMAMTGSVACCAAGMPAWTNVAGNVVVGEVVAVDATSVLLVTGAETQRVSRTVFPTAELARMGAADATERVPPALAPAWREFEAKCAAKTVTRGDLIVFKRFIAASALDDAAKTMWTRKARKRYQEVKGSKSKGS